jgi:hypothetical protein
VELLLLGEQKYELSDTGAVKFEPTRVFQKTKHFIAFSLRTAARNNTMPEAEIQKHIFGVDGWDYLGKALQVRHRLTHPKVVSDLLVTEEEMDWCRRAQEWFRNTMNRISNADEAKARRARRILDHVTQSTAQDQPPEPGE